MDWKWLLFSFHGRINRAKYWLTVLIYFIVGLVLGLITFLLGQGLAISIVAFIIEIVIMISGLAVATKRLHDRGRSAWWLVWFYVVPAVLVGIGTGIAMASGSWVAMWILGTIAVAIGLWAFVELACLRGIIGPNAYGPDPLEKGLID